MNLGRAGSSAKRRPTDARVPERAETGGQVAGADAPVGLAGGWRTRRWRSAVTRRALALCDLTAALTALLAVYLTDSVHPSTLFWAIVFSPGWIAVAKLNGLYDNDHRRIRHSTLDELPALITTSVVATLLVVGLLSLSPAPPLGGGEAIAIAAVALGGAIVLRSATRHLARQLVAPQAGILIGSASASASLARKLAVHPEAHLSVVGYLGPTPQEVTEGAADRGLPWLGHPSSLAAAAARHGVERVLIAEVGLSHAEVGDVISGCKRLGLALTMVPLHGSLLGPGTELNRLGELALLDFRFADPSRSTMLLKRCLDVLISAFLLIVLAPAFLLIAALIKLDSRGPILFKQVRIGQGGRPFAMLKFRSMVCDAEEKLTALVDLERLDQPAFKIRNDPRVTRVGRRLRRLSLDELPQLINVLRGQMSLVGPRPEEQAVVDLYDESQRTRLAIKPGMSGPMQIYGRGDLSFEERLALERDYMDNISLGGDLAILLRTPRAILRGDGAY